MLMLTYSHLLYELASTTNQISEQSWWPKQSTFLASGLYQGHWTTECEVWYQERLEAIQDGRATLHTARDWRVMLRGSKSRVGKYIATGQSLASHFIETLNALYVE